MNRPASPPASAQGYAEQTEVLAARYESISFAYVHRDTQHLMPAPPARILDIGAGTGRDAVALAALGHRVLAVEPTHEFRRLGERLHPNADLEWLDDTLPELSGVMARGEQFDLILLTAVWMHLDVDQRQVAMARLARLMRPASTIVMSLRHGPVPPGRRMFDVSYEETDELARQHGLRATFRSEREALLAGAGVRWTFLALTRDQQAQ